MADNQARSPDDHRRENICFNEAEQQDGFVIREGKEVVNIVPSRSGQRAPHSKLKYRNFVDYQWDFDQGNGRLVSTHYSGKFIAYVVKVSGVGAIRIVDLETNERGLMKGHKGLIKDVEFMHKEDQLVIGFVDEIGSVFVYRVDKDAATKKLTTILLLQINLPETEVSVKSALRRFIWCKYVPEDPTDQDTGKDCAYHFAVCQNEVVHVFNLLQLSERFSNEAVHSLNDFKGYFMTVDAHSDTVMDASFAPDGTALATASKDGTVKFFQVYMIGNESPRCLYSWPPHEGKPVGKIFFLDDHNIKTTADSQYWKYMLTANENMTEIKLWTCKTWKCLQIIKFDSPSPTYLRMDMDVSAHYLVLGDVHRKVMFVMHVEHDDDSARFDWITEFSLPSSMLSFNVNMARVAEDHDIPRHQIDFGNQPHTVVEVYFVQSKSLQQGTVIFPTPYNAYHMNGHNNVAHKEEPTDFAMESTGTNQLQGLSFTGNKSKTPSPLPQNLALPAKVEKMTEELSSLIGLPLAGIGGRKKSPSLGKSPEPLNVFGNVTNDANLLTSPMNVGKNMGITIPFDGPKTSSSSSPSREVEEIMSPKMTNDLVGHRTSPGIEMESPLSGEAEFSQEENDRESAVAELEQDARSSNGYSPSSPYIASNTLQSNMLSEEGSAVPQVLEQVQGIMEMLKLQAAELKELRREVRSVTGNQKQYHDDQSSENWRSHTQMQITRIEETVKNVEVLERQRLAQNNNPLPSNFAEILSSSIARTVRAETEGTILPSLNRSFEPTRAQIARDVEKLVSGADDRLKHDIRMILQSEGFLKALGTELKTSVKPVCEIVLKEVFLNNLVPKLEKAMQNALLQINDAFSKGTREYLESFQASVDRIKSTSQEKSDVQLSNQFLSMQDNLTTTLQVEMESQMLRVMQSLQTGVSKQLEDVINKELAKCFRDQQKFFEASLIPRSSTPALSTCSESFGPDPVQIQKQIMSLANSGDVSGAFTLATTTGNSHILMSLCKQIPPNKVFNPGFPLQTHLALIQQISTDLQGNTETKMNYLQTAITALDPSDRRVQQSIARIMPLFQGSMKKFLAISPETKFLNCIRLLEFALAGIANRAQVSSADPTLSPALQRLGIGGSMKHET